MREHIPVAVLQVLPTAHALSSPQHNLKALSRTAVGLGMQQLNCIQPRREKPLSQLYNVECDTGSLLLLHTAVVVYREVELKWLQVNSKNLI